MSIELIAVKTQLINFAQQLTQLALSPSNFSGDDLSQTALNMLKFFSTNIRKFGKHRSSCCCSLDTDKRRCSNSHSCLLDFDKESASCLWSTTCDATGRKANLGPIRFFKISPSENKNLLEVPGDHTRERVKRAQTLRVRRHITSDYESERTDTEFPNKARRRLSTVSTQTQTEAYSAFRRCSTQSMYERKSRVSNSDNVDHFLSTMDKLSFQIFKYSTQTEHPLTKFATSLFEKSQFK